MLGSVPLTQRQTQIFQATVRHYIATAEPVGSKTLVDGYDFSLSSATIRSTLSKLERAGLLYQPHPSAGRVPSDSGYRLYVDHLLSPSQVFFQQVFHVLEGKVNALEGRLEVTLRRAAQILASLSGYIAIVTLPQAQVTRLRHLQLVQVEPGQVLLILVTSNYESQSILVRFPSKAFADGSATEALDRELQILSNFLNYRLRGRLLRELTQIDWQELGQELCDYADILQEHLTALTRRYQMPEISQILVSGVSEVLRQPEFSELQHLQALLHLLEDEQEQLWSVVCALMEENTSASGIRLRIGSENLLESMRSCSLVAAPYHQEGVPVGSVGVLGPTRMLYEETIAAVGAASHYLSETLS
ncbi:MAG: heat-inducible transcriptional repressor HrcA [Prochlorotrichaceae cyanobacterium]